MKIILATTAAALVMVAAPAAAQSTYNDPAPGYSSLMSANYANAEREIRSAGVSADDPARAINLGIALAKQGRSADAANEFNRVLNEQDVEMVVANGQTVMSHEVASRAMAKLQSGELSQ